jgi:hypothetical protein
MKLSCYECEEMNQENGYCSKVKEYMLTGYAKLYYSQKCQLPPFAPVKAKILNKSLLQYKIKRYIDFWLPMVFLFFAFLWLAQSILTIVLANSIFTPIHLWFTPITMHVTTSLNCTLIYIISYLFYRTFFFGHERVVRTLLFMVLGVVFYDAIWSICYFVINGSGSFILPLVSTCVIVFYILILNKQKKIVDLNWKRIVPVALLYLVTLGIFINSGFFQQMALYNQGIGLDPNGWVWLVNKTVALWMWFVVAFR